MKFENSKNYAAQLDAEDPLRHYRTSFHFPKVNGKDVIYFAGNSLGLQPKNAQSYIDEVMDSWRDRAVEGHFNGERPWWDYHERLAEPLSRIVGAKSHEITVMNTLTVNLHLLLVSFYRPTASRYKIICEEKAFPSDQYVVQSQLRYHGLDPQDALIEVSRREGEHIWHTEDILKAIEAAGDSLAMVFIGGVNYYNGQVFDMEAISGAARSAGAIVGYDLAHAAGNVELKLHEWEVDFAAWCSYKYMNSGPGNASGVFIHEKHHGKDLPRFEGWWGTKKETRFQMKPVFEPIGNADAWQLSNPPILALAPYLASLKIFDEVGMDALVAKQKKLVAYLEFVLQEIDKDVDSTFEIITPKSRGCQLSVFLHGEGRPLFDYLLAHGVIADWREPNVIRLAPAPLYCGYGDMYEFGQVLKSGILEKTV